MQLEFTSLIVGGVVGSFLTIALASPRLGRIVASAIAVVLIAAGSGFLIWAASSMAGIGEFRPIGSESVNVSTPTESLGIGCGLLIGGIAAISLCLRRGHK